MELTPRQIVHELDRFIVGQEEAKKSVAIALRNRYRRSRVPEELRDEISPKNIMMIGPTGVGKTEIARRLAKLVNAPFVKVEATKFTEVGYVGRDVESIIRDLTENAIHITRRVEYSHVLSSHHNETIPLSLRILHTRHHILFVDWLTADDFIAHKTQSTIRGDITVDKMFDSPQVSNNNRWAIRSGT